jgi:hypothetical protein
VLAARGMIGHVSADPLRACVKVADCCDLSSACTLTCIKMIEMCVENVFAIVYVRFTIADCFFFFW